MTKHFPLVFMSPMNMKAVRGQKTVDTAQRVYKYQSHDSNDWTSRSGSFVILFSSVGINKLPYAQGKVENKYKAAHTLLFRQGKRAIKPCPSTPQIRNGRKKKHENSVLINLPRPGHIERIYKSCLGGGVEWTAYNWASIRTWVCVWDRVACPTNWEITPLTTRQQQQNVNSVLV